jgi:glycosyltransferase involved in cell wall biosynthesis
MPNRTKIAFVFPPNWTPHSDGSLQIWNQQVTRLLAKQYSVRVYTGLFEFQPREIIEGVEYRRFNTRWDQRFLKRFEYLRKFFGINRRMYATDLWFPLYAKDVAADLRKDPCDVVHVYNQLQFAHAIKRSNPKSHIVLNMHGEWLTQLAFADIRKRLGEVDSIVSCSDYLTRCTSAGYPDLADRCRTVPMGMSPEKFLTHQESSGVDKAKGPRLLYMGRVSPEKGIHVLTAAFELLLQRYPEATLDIAGPEWIPAMEDYAGLCLDSATLKTLEPFYQGSYVEILKKRLSPAATRRVRFVGLVSHGDVPKYYQNSDIYVSAAFYESFGMSLIEAMAAELPVVASQGGSVADIVRNRDTGILVPAGQPAEIAAAVSELFENPELAISLATKARQMAQSQFSWSAIASSLSVLYESLQGEGARALYPASKEITA